MTGSRHVRWRERWARQQNYRHWRAYQSSLAAWQRQDAEHRRRLEVATTHQPTPEGAPWLRRARGETIYWVGGGVGMVEPPAPAGLRPPDYREAAAEPTHPGGPAAAGPPVDTGPVAVTSRRVVFVGRARREWAYAKLTGLAHAAGGQTLMLVSNRKKVSGLVPLPEAAADFRLHLAIAMADAAGDRAGLVAWLREQAERHQQLMPRPPTPATADQAPWSARLGRRGGLVAILAGSVLLVSFCAIGIALAGNDQRPESQPEPAGTAWTPAAAAQDPTRSPAPAESSAARSPSPEPDRPAATPAPAPAPAGDCAAYVNSDGWCVDGTGDYDCAEGTGNGPNYVTGPVRVVDIGRDPFGLDRNNDGEGCEEPAAAPAPAPPPPDQGTNPRFDTCKDAIAAGYGPYRRGQDPEYDWYRDADGDGVVCE